MKVAAFIVVGFGPFLLNSEAGSGKNSCLMPVAVSLCAVLTQLRCFNSGILFLGYAGAQLSGTGNSNTGPEGAVRPDVGWQVHNVDVRRVNGLSSGCSGAAG